MQQNVGKIFKGLAEMQKRTEAIQKELGEATFEGASAQGLVKVTVTGKGELKRVYLDPAIMSEDSEIVADLVVVAAKNAHDAKEVLAKAKLASISAGLLPMGFKIPGLG